MICGKHSNYETRGVKQGCITHAIFKKSLSRLGVAVTEPISSVQLFAQFVQRRQSCWLMEYQVQNISVMQRILRVFLQKDKRFSNGEIDKRGC